MTGPDESKPYPNSWFLTMNRVEANMPTETERRAAEYLYNRGWVNPNVNTADRNRARQTFINGMRTGFKDRSYNFNWTVWRTEYERTGYPPGSFDPAQGNDPNYRDPSVLQGTGGMTPAEQRQLRRDMRNNPANNIRGFGKEGAPRGNTQRGFGQRGDTPNTSQPMRGFGESDRAYRKRLETGQSQGPREQSSGQTARERTARRVGESERAYRARLRRQGDA